MIVVNGVKFNDEQFHNGEVIFKKPEVNKDSYQIIEMYFKDNRDIANLWFARQYLKEVLPNKQVVLIMKYCPYERMDREINDQMFSMKYFAQFIATCDFDIVYVLDPHSRVCINELKNCGVNVNEINLENYIDKVISDFKPDYICYPDKGAHSKYPNVLSKIEIPCFYGQKTRDLTNKGKITEYELVDAPDLKDKRVLIIDDICCLGGTAYNAAVQMKLAGAKEVAFYISHCEDGIFVGKILAEEPFYPNGSEENLPWAGKYTIDKVYTANTMKLSKTHNNIIIVE